MKEGFFHYEQLDSYKLAYRLAIEIHKFCGKLPKIEQYKGIGDQLRRSSKSVCANIAEGMSKLGSTAEEVRFLRIAKGSAEECRVWTRFCIDLAYVDEALEHE
jgi:four helix bundle protein